MSPRAGPAARLAPTLSEDTSIDVNALVTPYLPEIAVALGLLGFVLLLVVVVLARRVGSLRGRLDALTRGVEGRSLEAVLDAHLDKVFAVSRELDELAARSAVLEAHGRRAVQRIGLVRYNPYEDTGGNQSFALALLDANGDGLLVNSLHTRNGTRVYAKALTGGRADGPLSDEETEALRRATSDRVVGGVAASAAPGGPAAGPESREAVSGGRAERVEA